MTDTEQTAAPEQREAEGGAAAPSGGGGAPSGSAAPGSGERKASSSLFDPAIVRPALLESVRKLDPRVQVRNPVMFVVEIGAVITTGAWLIQVFGGESLGGGHQPAWFSFTITVWLWLTVVFANLAEALAEGRGRAQADSLRAMRTEATAKMRDGGEKSAAELVRGDIVVVEAGEGIPGDGTVIEGIASVDESAITGESAPVIREAGGDRSAVTGGTKVLSDRIVVEITQEPGGSFLDRMISLVEGASRRKTPNEIALGILLSGLTLVFIIVVVSLRPFALFAGTELSEVTLIALLIALIPTTIGALLSAIGIAGMDRLVRRNVLALSGRAVEASGDCDVLLLDKTGTITLGNREATEFIPMPGVSEEELAEAAQMSSLADETPEGRSIVVLAKEKFNIREHDFGGEEPTFVPFTAETRMSGVDFNGTQLRKGAGDAVAEWITAEGGHAPPELRTELDRIGREGGTPLAVARDERVLGVVYLKDVVKEGMKARFDQLRAMGIRTIMVTGDNKLTAAKIAEEAGVDDFLAEATPERKLELIKEQQADGRLIAMTGDGTNDAPALAQADVGVAMNTGTQAAREAGNMVDLDSNPTKLIEIVEVGKQLLITRGALTTFSIANDVAKYFAILPAMFAATYAAAGSEKGPLDALNIMHLGTPESAILSAIIFNAMIIPLLIPLSLKGVKYRAIGATALLRRNILIYGLGGLIVPFVGIKAIDLVVHNLLGA
jgi:potassium-transporting ATPase ATP-binding subunit